MNATESRLIDAARAAARRLADGAPMDDATLAEIQAGAAAIQRPRATPRSADRYVRAARRAHSESTP